MALAAIGVTLPKRAAVALRKACDVRNACDVMARTSKFAKQTGLIGLPASSPNLLRDCVPNSQSHLQPWHKKLRG